METEHKSITLELKDMDTGAFTARIATLNVIDKDGDLTLPGAFPNGKEVLVSAYQHESWFGSLPVGKAILRESGDDVIAEGNFNLASTTGREHYEAVKFSGDLQEWSYGFRITESGDDEEIEKWAEKHDGARPVRMIKGVEPYEISPVLLGAGVGTGTLAIKSEDTKLVDHVEAVLAAVATLSDRLTALAALRREKGRNLSAEHRQRLINLKERLDSIGDCLKDLSTTEDEKSSLYLASLKAKLTYMEVI